MNNIIISYDDLICMFLKQKIINGYEPYVTLTEFNDFIKFASLYGVFDEDNLDKTKILGSNNTESNILTDIIIPTYTFSQKDCLYKNKLTKSNIELIETIINDYLKKLPKRQVKSNFTNKELDYASNISSALTLFVWKQYVLNNVEQQKWPIQCGDIYEYLLKEDLAKKISVPSIKDELLSFYDDSVLRVASLLKENSNFEAVKTKRSFLASANIDFITNGYDSLFSLVDNKIYGINANKGLFYYMPKKSKALYQDDEIKRVFVTREEIENPTTLHFTKTMKQLNNK